MHSHSGISRKWRRLNRKFGSGIFVGFLILVIIAVVGFLMYVISSPEWRLRW